MPASSPDLQFEGAAELMVVVTDFEQYDPTPVEAQMEELTAAVGKNVEIDSLRHVAGTEAAAKLSSMTVGLGPDATSRDQAEASAVMKGVAAVAAVNAASL